MNDNNLFFFQAEDGIRDLYVTGVQTCALPILLIAGAIVSPAPRWRGQPVLWPSPQPRSRGGRAVASVTSRLQATSPSTRSEERRVGKECRSRWSGNHHRKSHHIMETLQID